MEKDIIDRLNEEINDLTKLQKKVSDYVLKEPMQAAFSTVDQLAHHVGVSTTTVVRLATSLGYSGYMEFQKDLQEYLKHKASPSNKLEINVTDKGGRSDLERTIHEITQIQLQNIDKTYRAFTDDQFIQAEQMIRTANHIYICGSRSCYSLAYHLNYNLDRMFGKSDVVAVDMGEITEKMRRMTPEDLIISMSMARYNRMVVDVARLAKEKGCASIVITDGYNSPLAQYADLLFLTHCKSVDFHNSMVAASYLCEILVGICTMHNPDIVRANLKKTEFYLNKFDVMMQK